MKKYIVKALSVLMAMLMVLSVGTVASAETDTSSDTEIVYRYSIIGTTGISFSISGVKASCGATLSAQYSTSLKINMELQKKSNGSYSTVKTWTKNDTGTGTGISGSKVINPLSTYRLKVTYTAGIETVTRYKYE